jgi:hypothetical protein
MWPMANLVGGRLTLERGREKGAAFVLSLPATADQELAAS